MKLFIVRAEVRGCPESILGGVYPTDQLAEARCEYLREEGWDTVWYDTVEMGFHGVDCELDNSWDTVWDGVDCELYNR